MALRPQCTKFALPYTKESSYNAGVTDAKLTKLFYPSNPLPLDITQDVVNDADDIKGNEFPVDSDASIVTAHNVSIPFEFPCSVQLAGLLLTYALGDISISGAGDPYTHTLKCMDACSDDQLPSLAAMLGFGSDTASYWLAKGLVVNELTISFDNQGRAKISGTFIGSGDIDANTDFTFPTTLTAADYLTGTQADFTSGDFGGSQTSKKSVLMSASFKISNNIDVADGRSLVATAGVNLASARFGKRTYSLEVKVNGHRGDAYWTDFEAQTVKEVTFSLTKSVSRSISIELPQCRISACKEGFSGIRDTLDLTYDPFWDTTASSPVVVTVVSGDATYTAA